ncbi:hypothetical protein EV424DRAFT_1352227 [Suillus variegatus]|nr:hypothetical protein EV424DRAFT_1352227 [Suillus variegatus]
MFVVLHDFEPMLECAQDQWILKHPPLKDKLPAPQSHQGPRCQFNGRAKLPSLMPWILFYLEGKKKMADADDNPTGKDKGHIYSAIAGLIFVDHIKYGTTYRQNPKKFCNSVSNQISGLRTKYKKHKGRFTATGAGIMPHDGQSMQNLLALVCADFPWFSDLDSIWHKNPSMVAKTYLSQPGVDHAGTLYSLVQPHGKAGPLMHFGATAGAGPSIPAAQSSHAYPPPNLPPSTYPPLTSFINELLNANVPKRLSPLTSSINKPLNTNVPQRLPLMTSSVNKLGFPECLTCPPAHIYPLTHIRPPNKYPPPNKYLLPNAFPSPNTGTPPCPPFHLPGLYNSLDVDIRDDFGADDDLYSENTSPLSVPLGDALEHLDSDEMMDHDGDARESPPRATGKKHQPPTSPSPPPNVLSPFEVPVKSPTSLYNSRLAFGAQKPSSHGRQCKPLLEMSCSILTPSSTTHNTTPLSDYHMSPTPQTSLLNSAGGSKKKKAKSDVLQEQASTLPRKARREE